MKSRRGYIRGTAREPIETQRSELERYGCDEIYIEGEGAQSIEAAVISVRPGDELVVTTLDRIAASKRGLRPWLERLREIGAVVVETRTGRRSDSAADVEGMVLDAITRKGHPTELAREYGKLGAAKRRVPPSRLKRAEKFWDDPSVKSACFKRKTGVSYHTMRRHMGRGRNVKPGPRPKAND